MGPIALFDKSFLQSLSVDESVWFDRFFLPVICPLFYVETLADLEKAVRQGRTPEQEVGIIAQKVPEMSGNVVAHHTNLALGTMLGRDVPLDGRIPRSGGRQVESDGKKGYVYEPSKEQEAFDRWQKGEFLEVERLFAKIWRAALTSMDQLTVEAGIRALGVQPEACKSLETAKELAISFSRRTDLIQDRIKLALIILGTEKTFEGSILERMASIGWPSLAESAPFAAHVISIELFFHISIAANLISAERASNRTDMAYLYYLPFCHVFISSDRLHQRCAPHFLRADQSFVWGPELKDALQQVNRHYDLLSESEKEKGLTAIASAPPKDNNGLVAQLWDKHLPGWREKDKSEPPGDPATDRKLVEEINRFTDAPRVADEPPLGPDEVEAVVIQRRVHKKKGSWWQLPRDLKDDQGTSGSPDQT